MKHIKFFEGIESNNNEDLANLLDELYSDLKNINNKYYNLAEYIEDFLYDPDTTDEKIEDILIDKLRDINYELDGLNSLTYINRELSDRYRF